MMSAVSITFQRQIRQVLFQKPRQQPQLLHQLVQQQHQQHHHQIGNGKGQGLFELSLAKFVGTMPTIMIIMEALLATPVKHFFAEKLL